MESAQARVEIGRIVDEEFESWFARYNPVRHDGADAIRYAQSAGENFSWTVVDEFLQDYLTLSNGRELSYIAINIIPGIEESDTIFTSSRSWSALGDEDRIVPIEVVTDCLDCAGAGGSCELCGGSGEWVFVPAKWEV